MFKSFIAGFLIGFSAVTVYAEVPPTASPATSVNALAHTLGGWLRSAFDFSVEVGKSFMDGVKRNGFSEANPRASARSDAHDPEQVPVEERSVYAEPASTQ